MAKIGRPQVEIDWGEFEKLCAIQSTLPEMAGWFNCSQDTIQRAVARKYGEPFAAVYEQKRGKGKISLRRALWQAALGGNPTMMIWLSKQTLGMSDKVQVQEVQEEAEFVDA